MAHNFFNNYYPLRIYFSITFSLLLAMNTIKMNSTRPSLPNFEPLGLFIQHADLSNFLRSFPKPASCETNLHYPEFSMQNRALPWKFAVYCVQSPLLLLWSAFRMLADFISHSYKASAMLRT